MSAFSSSISLPTPFEVRNRLSIWSVLRERRLAIGIAVALTALLVLSGISCGSDQTSETVRQQPTQPQPAPTAEPVPTPEPLATTRQTPVTPQPPPTPAPLRAEEPTAVPQTATPTPLAAVGPTPIVEPTPEPTVTATPTPTPTVVPAPEATATARLRSHDDLARCDYWAMDRLDGVRYARFATLDPASMSDIERALWGQDLGVTLEDPIYLGGVSKWCKDYWSEPLSASNADKRNEQYRASCWENLDREADDFNTRMGDYIRKSEENQQSDVIAPRSAVNQYVRLMNWIDIPGRELLTLPERPHELVRRLRNDPELEEIFDTYELPTSYHHDSEVVRTAEANGTLRWWGLGVAFDIDNDVSLYCALYYPQLFTGRWIPLDADDQTPTPLPELSDLALHGPGRSMFVPDEYTRPK